MEWVWVDGEEKEVREGVEAVMCPVCFATNEPWRERCRNCGAELILLSYEQEDLIIEEGIERERMRK